MASEMILSKDEIQGTSNRFGTITATTTATTIAMETIGLDTIPIDDDLDSQSKSGSNKKIDDDETFHHDTVTALRFDGNIPWYHRRKVRCGITFGLLIIAIVAIAVPFSNKNKQIVSLSTTTLTANTKPLMVDPEISAHNHQSNKDAFSRELISYYNTYGLDSTIPFDDDDDEDSPQTLAIDWVTGRSQYNNTSRSRNIQRYALAVLYYSTFNVQHEYWNEELGDSRVGWTSAVNWISDESECEWEGITCDGEGVMGILLREHNLSGYLPLELAFLSTSLITIDLTFNLIYVNGDESITPFSHLKKVSTLLLDDNFVVTSRGLPNGFGNMKQLTKLSFSYNLLQGHLDGSIFTNLSKLTHLDIESNFLRGHLPHELLNLKKLENIYIRNNYLDLHLPSVFANGTFLSVNSIWMDDNNVTGPIPSSIKDKTVLASLSITNTSLAGSIPSEMGLLLDLKRLWLCDNALTGEVPTQMSYLINLEIFEVHGNDDMTGDMPVGVCEIIDSSEYEFRSLTATCKALSCSCCTKCY